MLRARWNAELDRTKKLLREKKRMEQEAAFRATKEAKDKLKNVEKDAEMNDLRMQREQEKAWRIAQERKERSQKQREKMEAAQKLQEERNLKELDRQQDLAEKNERAAQYAESMGRKRSEEQVSLRQRKRILMERQQAAAESRYMKVDEEEAAKDVERREGLLQSELEFAWKQRQVNLGAERPAAPLLPPAGLPPTTAGGQLLLRRCGSP